MKTRLDQVILNLRGQVEFNIILLSLIFGFQMCASKDYYKKETKIFNKYLDTFSEDIPQEGQLYIIYSNIACNGCISLASQAISEHIGLINESNTTVIYTNPDIIPEMLLQRGTCIFDKCSEIDYINLNIYNVSLIETKDRQIIKIKSVTPNTIISFKEFLNSYYMSKSQFIY